MPVLNILLRSIIRRYYGLKFLMYACTSQFFLPTGLAPPLATDLEHALRSVVHTNNVERKNVSYLKGSEDFEHLRNTTLFNAAKRQSDFIANSNAKYIVQSINKRKITQHRARDYDRSKLRCAQTPTQSHALNERRYPLTQYSRRDRAALPYRWRHRPA